MNEPSSANHRGANGLELGLAAVGIAVVIAVEMWISQAWRLIGHHLWLDEVLTWMLASDPGWGHWLGALRGGVDTNPPGLYLQVKAAGVLAGGLTVGTLRWVALIWTGLSVWGIYAVLRRGVGVWAAAAGGLLVLAYPMVLDHALEGRFYMPMLGMAVWVCYFLAGIASANRRWFGQLMLGVCAVGLCTIHYFGVIALAAAVAGQWWADRHSWREKMRFYWPALAGPAALAACIPLLLGQRAGLSVPTWVEPLSGGQIWDYTQDLLAIRPLAIVAGGFVLLRLFGGSMEQEERTISFRPLAGMMALGAMAVFVLLFSWVVQPALVSRYAIVSVAALAVAVAVAMQHTRRWVVAAVCVGLAAYSTWSLNSLRMKWMTFDRNIDKVAMKLSQTSDEPPMIFDMRQMAYPVAAAYPNLRNRIFYWGGSSNPSPYSSNFKQYELEMARRVDRYYGWPQVMEQGQLDRLDDALVIGFSADQRQLENIFYGRKVLPVLEMKRFSIYRIKN
ncbi:MAG: glycosyltransferase family 39 protein [Phycisphaerales bacterium]|nr:glycosyltransferase family 39 protein [Phycisphaerales bacterium]